MKVRLLSILALALAFACLTAAGETPAAGQPNANEPPPVIQCNKEVLHSYMLKGRENSGADKMHLCPDIKSNCCTKLDQQHIYHVVNDILPPRLVEYQSKIKMALSKLKLLHKHIMKANPVFTGSVRRRAFCSQQMRKVMNFPFVQLHNTVIDELELTHEENKEHYEKFYCILCDGQNHPFMDFAGSTPKLMVDMDFCKDFLTKRTDIIKLLNVELVDYLVSLQNVVDCTHYVKSYNLNFFDAQKIAASKETTVCLNYISGKNFLKYCKPVCERIRFSKITELVDGDYEFIIDAVNLFEKFFEFKETGNFISMKLRLFFKKFVIPRTLSRNKRARFLSKLRLEAEEKRRKKKLEEDKKLLAESKNNGGKGKARKLVVKRRSHAEKPKHKVVAKRRKERKLMLVGGESPVDRFVEPGNVLDANLRLFGGSTKAEALAVKVEGGTVKAPALARTTDALPAAQEASVAHLNLGRVLAARATRHERILDGKSPAAGQGDNKKPNDPNRPKPTAKLVYDKELFDFYKEIHISKSNEKAEHIFRIQTDPIDFDKPQKNFVADTGINSEKYSNTKFDFEKHIFYKLLFQYRKPDQVDPNLSFFLADFTPNFVKDVKIDLRTDFKIEVINYNIGKVKKGKLRLLAESPERALREDYAQRTIFGQERIKH